MSDAKPKLATGLTLRSLTTRTFYVPMNFALGTSAAMIKSAPILLLDALMEEGVVGRSYVFCYTSSGAMAIAAHIAQADEFIKGHPCNPQSIALKLSRRFALLGVTGTVRMALSALDMALWDAVAIALGKPLAEVVGADRRPIPAYDSRGLGLMRRDALADEAEALLESGLKAVKLRLGHPTLAEDLSA